MKGEETYVRYQFTSNGYFPVEELYVKDDKGTALQAQELYIRNPLAAGGYETIYINAAAAVPDVTIVSVTEPAVEQQDVTVVANTPAGALSYQFQLDFSGVNTNWLTLQDGSSNVWSVPASTEGYFWRVNVTADDGTTTDTETFNSSGRIQGSSSETILDTYTATGSTWRAGNGWYNSFTGGSWSSTGTSSGDYITMDSGSYIRYFSIRTGPAGSTAIPAGAVMRVTYDSGQVLIDAAQNPLGYGTDLRFDYNPQYNQTEFGPTGNVGADEGGFKIELIIP